MALHHAASSEVFAQVQGVTVATDQHQSEVASFEQGDFEAGLQTHTLGRTLLTARAVDSTQTVLIANRATLPSGTPSLLQAPRTRRHQHVQHRPPTKQHFMSTLMLCKALFMSFFTSMGKSRIRACI
jgi:hypothetical protein